MKWLLELNNVFEGRVVVAFMDMLLYRIHKSITINTKSLLIISKTIMLELIIFKTPTSLSRVLNFQIIAEFLPHRFSQNCFWHSFSKNTIFASISNEYTMSVLGSLLETCSRNHVYEKPKTLLLYIEWKNWKIVNEENLQENKVLFPFLDVPLKLSFLFGWVVIQDCIMCIKFEYHIPIFDTSVPS